MTVAWDMPDSDGGLPITGYVIERRDAKGGWITAGTVDSHARSFKISTLLEGNEYFIRVMAENAAGTGLPVETAQPVEVRSPYGTSFVFLFQNKLIQCMYTCPSIVIK